MKRKSIRAALVASLTVVMAGVGLTVAGPAMGATGSPLDPANLSNNPVLATNLTGWQTSAGGSTLTRTAISDHVAANYAAQTISSSTTTRVKAPSEPINATGAWTYAADVKARSGASASITVEWLNSTGGYLSHVESPFVTVNPTNWTRRSFTTTPPANAISGRVQVNVINTARNAVVQVTMHDVRSPVVTPPTTTTVPPTTTTTTPPPAETITNLPGQPAITAYSDDSAGVDAAVRPFVHKGALAIAGRTQYGNQVFKDLSAAGGTELIYIDAIIDASYGRYHTLLVNVSECGPATARWPGSPQANQWGYLQDFRVGSVVASKLECVLEKMVAENPHMGGFFADDLGSRSWFPGFNWDTWGTANQQAYRDGAINLAHIFRTVADRHGLMVMVNGSWGGGTLASNGGGYPNMATHGLSLAEGGYIEHHSTSELPYWTNYAKGQWAAATPAVGKPFMYVQASDAATRNAYNNANVFAFLSAQDSYDTADVWGPFHPTGLPSKVKQ